MNDDLINCDYDHKYRQSFFHLQAEILWQSMARQKIHEAVLSWPRWISGSGLIDLLEKFIQRGDRASASLWPRLSFNFI